MTDRWFSPVSSTNKTDRHDITEILLKVALNAIKPKPIHDTHYMCYHCTSSIWTGEHTEKIHLSDFKTAMLHFSSYELYIYFQVFIINVDILFIHDAYYMSAIIVRVRSGQEGVSKYD